MFQRYAELPDVHGVVVGEFDFVLDNVCPPEVKLPLAYDIMIPVEHLPVCRRPWIRRLDVDMLVQEGQLLLGGLPDGSSGWFLWFSCWVPEDFR